MVSKKLMVIAFVTFVAARQAKQSDTQVVAQTVPATTPGESSTSSDSANKPAGNAMENQAQTEIVEQQPVTAAGKPSGSESDRGREEVHCHALARGV